MFDLVPPEPSVVSPPVLPLRDEARLVAAINSIADKEFVPYLQEAWHCFTGRAYHAAILCTWAAVSRYVKQAVENIPLGEDLFKFRFVNLKSTESTVENNHGGRTGRRGPYKGRDDGKK